jgi:hypothetical protein
MQRREFIAALGSAVAWPLAASGQQPERMRRVGVLMNLAADDGESPVRVGAFARGLEQLGWMEGHNVQIDIRWGQNDADREQRYASENRRKPRVKWVQQQSLALFGKIRQPPPLRDAFLREEGEKTLRDCLQPLTAAP